MFSNLFWKSEEKQVDENLQGVTSFTINGKKYKVNLSKLPADITLNTFIREHAQLTATKYICLEGGCGACIVAIKGKHPVTGKLKTWATNSCLTFLNVCSNWEIWTCEGIGNSVIGYHALQQRLAVKYGSQCGFCSPGFIMNMYALMESKDNQLSLKEIENSFGGNICRCTGYRPILDAMKSFASDSCAQQQGEYPDIEDFVLLKCPKTGVECLDKCHNSLNSVTYADGSVWRWPKTFVELQNNLSAINSKDEYMLVAGNTAHGVYRRSENIKYFIDINGIAELKKYSVLTDRLILGAGLRLSETMDIFLEVSSTPGFEYCQKLWQHFDLIANVPVRNSGTLAGNITIKKEHRDFPSDIFITFEALDVRVNVYSYVYVKETLTLMDFLNKKATKTIITSFVLKAYPKEKFIFDSYKIMSRAQNSHAYVNAAFLIETAMPSGLVKTARVCFGGISPDFVHTINVEKLLKGKVFFQKEVVQKTFTELENSIRPIPDLVEASPEYRRKLSCGLYLKFLLINSPQKIIRDEYKSGGPLLKRILSSGSQVFPSQKDKFPLTQPIQKVEGAIQCSGEAKYMNDKLTAANSGHCAFVVATRVGATIANIDASQALQMPGVIAFFSAKDIPGENNFVDTSNKYEKHELFCSGQVLYYDQPLGLIVAESNDIAMRAAGKVKVIYSKSSSFIMPTMRDVLAKGNVQRINQMTSSTFAASNLNSDPSDIHGKGVFEIGPQYHFSMEPQTCIAIPFERGIQVFSATQWMDQTQIAIARMLKISSAKVQLEVRRLGGAFGCKISWGNQVACAASLAAFKLDRPVRFVQTIESMMNSNGKRWACRSDYEFHCNSSAKILRLRNNFYEDAGCNLNENPVTNYTMPAVRNCYDLPQSIYEVNGHAVITDAPSNCWCRAPGSLEAIAMTENIIEHIAFASNVDPADVRLINLKGDNKMTKLLPNFVQSTEYRKRRIEIDEFNSKNRWLKRGLGMAIMEFPIHYIGQFSATVSIYHADGSVVISHGGIEMGQGVNTKAAQVAAYILGIPLDLVKIEASNTIIGANSFITGGSIGTDCVCYVVRKCCNTLKERLQPIKDSLSQNATWSEIIHAAWTKLINLIASEHYKMGDMQNYNIYGLALTEVEIDILTGNTIINRADIVEDAGESLSPYMDIGQVEGGFVMALGYWLMENLIYDRQTGKLLTNRTWNYKVPGAKDIPIDFRIELLQGSANAGGFLRSKSTGEPPSCTAVSVLFAIQHALQSARDDAGLPKEYVRLGAPTTPETIVLNAGNEPTTFSLE